MARRRRQKSSGSVRQLPSVLWQARLHTLDGRRPAVGTYEERADAERALALAAADAIRGVQIDPRHGKVTLEAYALEWLDSRGTIRPRTRELYAGLLKWHILPQLGGRQLASISPLVVRQWHAGLMAGHLGPVSVAKCYRLLKTVMATAVEDGFIVKSPCVIKGAGVERSAERPIATIEQVDCLAAAIEPRFRALVLLATYGSLRFGELAALTRRRVDLKAGTVSVVVAQSELGDGTRLIGEPKTAAGRRVVAIPPVILEELQHHLAVFSQPGPDGLVFVGPKGAALRRGNFSHVWKKAARSVGLEDLHFHDLRHTGNTLAATTGASTRELMTRMGHSSARAALLYHHATAEREHAIGRALGEMIVQARQANVS